MVKMSWAYIAGFFDGEGSVTRRMLPSGHAVPGRISIAQTQERGRLVFVEMQAFLAAQGIRAAILDGGIRREGYKRIYYLNISSVPGCLAFLKTIYPHLRIKRVEAQDAIRYLTLYPPHSTADIERVSVSAETLASMYNRGMTAMEISRETGIKYDTTWKILRRVRFLLARPFGVPNVNPSTEELADLFNSGLNTAQVGREVGMTKTAVWKRLARHRELLNRSLKRVY